MKKPFASLLAWLGLTVSLAAAETVDYVREIKPLLARRCGACHGALTQKSGLRLDTAAAIRKGGESGPAVVAGQSGESLLIEAVTGADGWRMPPEAEGEALSAADVGLLKSWIDQGAQSPADEAEPPDPRKHWAFRPPSRPAVPSRAAASPLRNPIDAFLDAELRARNLQPGPPASKDVLIRRVSLDLTGLAASPEAIRAFVNDPAADAYEKLVDRLLTSPQYGERWGRHWMDVWRYSDWDGYGQEVRESQPHIWRWRDWIVESLNRDEGYDRMIVAMLAADELAPGDPAALRATGYLARNWYKFNRNVWLDNTVEHTAKAFLGITLNCARCHDHKYDPIAQEDYYKFRAFFEPHTVRTDRVPGQPDPIKDGLPRVYDSDAKAPTYLFHRGDEKTPVKEKPLAPGVPRSLARGTLAIEPIALPSRAYYPGLNRFIRDETLARARVEVAAKQAALAKAGAGPTAVIAEKALAAARAHLAALEVKIAADQAKYAVPPRPDAERLARAAGRSERRSALAAADLEAVKAAQARDVAAKAVKPGDDKTKAALAVAEKKRDDARKALEAAQAALKTDTSSYAPIGTVYPSSSTGRRLALARWIASGANPLTARVAVNHVWMRHFGAPLVPTVFDFGVNGKPPTHPALLDWLAVELVERGWSLKALHRLIMTSQAYRRQSSASGPGDANLAADPENRYLWRMNARRMEAEVVRDNLLLASGTLDSVLGGPDIDPDQGQTSRRRSLYFRHAKEKRVQFLKLFDSANATSCYRRSESVVPQQALALANSPIALAQARVLAASLSKESGSDPCPSANARFVNLAFMKVLGRAPLPDERELCASYLVEQAGRLTARAKLTAFASGPAAAVKPSTEAPQRAREDLVHVLFNHNDFVTIR